jgi:hypothetical protein
MTKKVFLKFKHPYSDIELDYWLKLFNSPACKVTKTENGEYYLTACRFERLEHKEFRKSQKRLITMMVAFAKMELSIDFHSIERDEENFISDIHEPVGGNVYIDVTSATAIAWPTIVNVVMLDEDGTVLNQEGNWYDFYLDQCDDWIDNTVVFKALSYFAKKTEPLALRLAYETIVGDEGGVANLLSNYNLEEDELNSFYYSIHNIEGQELHAEERKEKNYTPISLYEAQKWLAQRLLKPWLIKKRDSYKLAEEDSTS